MRDRVTITRGLDGRYLLFSAYDAELIVLIKQFGGRWNPTAKQWWFGTQDAAASASRSMRAAGWSVLEQYEDPVSDELDRLRRRIRDLEMQLAFGRATGPGSDRHIDLDMILRTGGLPAYRALSKVFHPDSGGDLEMMKVINAAWDRIGRDSA